ncbi:MAG: helix-turn-helix domain-containing protein [Coriobacteriaceae bacterium]|uniref:helix-turn-helix domain-containing protein n=1 Tax=Tractidigestivibacter sp. TaxID=2847320 RepID=UPI002A7FD5FD|nr:helix-turn-helix transcriptional regulator [Tractidigestivibacter sp.]MCI6547867.1 helix-turn-helix domain-containing protein [Coriobacteriaceae bacterium]MCI6844644.1 helix-turn-helix domain-containing protein [Coriobacteriaceae bacterium]MDD7584545.1 helix-turn-helix transcriptional regulator [Coriobacteriaceae bacterium]MDY4535569.1 helix-turn-helix transcriptional regulator [Tractidigestivibacter sp.]
MGVDDDKLVRERVAARLVVAWRRSGLTCAEVAERSGVSAKSFQRYLSASRFPSGWALMKICPVLGVSADWLLGVAGTAPGAPSVGRAVTARTDWGGHGRA